MKLFPQRVIFAVAACSFAAASLAQPDARVRLQVVRDICSGYRPDTLQQITGILKHEKNPEIQAEAVRALGKFQQAEARQQILACLGTASFGNILADAAVDAIAMQRAARFRQPLIDAIQSGQNHFTSRGLGDALTTLAGISRTGKNRSQVRELLLTYLHDPRPRVQRSPGTPRRSR